MYGKRIRNKKIFSKSDRVVLVPLDHGVTIGPDEGTMNLPELVRKLDNTRIDGVILHKGSLLWCERTGMIPKNIEIIIHISASTILAPDENSKQLICSVEEAIRLGATGISIQINLGSASEPQMLRDLGTISEQCYLWGMPLLVMGYIKKQQIEHTLMFKHIAHAARLACELGADIIKVPYSGSIDSFKLITQCVDIPVVIAGGTKHKSDESLLTQIEDSLLAGGRGVCIGRNIFQHSHPQLIAEVICRMVHENVTAREALDMLNKSIKPDERLKHIV